MNWGYKILFVYAIFIAGILFLVIKSSSQNQDLVVTDYYEQELKFQQKIDETVRTNSLSAKVNTFISGDELIINFPAEMVGQSIKANVLLYYPADKTKDITRDLTTTDGKLHFKLTSANKGLHKLKLNWQVSNTGYYYEQKIILP